MAKQSSNYKLTIPLILLLLFLIIWPILSIFSRAIIHDGKLDFLQAQEILSKSENLQMIANSLLLAALVVIVTTLIATPLAFLFSKTEFARYKSFDLIFLIPFMTPPYIASMGWILFMQKRGLLQQLLPATAGSEDLFFSLAGLVLVMSLHLFPFAFTILKNAMINLPDSLDEAAAIYGAASRRRIFKISLPLLSGNYAIAALLIFVKAISEYGTPATLGRRIGFKVFSTDIHRYATVAPVDFGSSATLASVLTGICLVIWLLQNHISNARQYNLLNEKSGKPALRVLSPWGKVVAWLYIILILSLAIVVPYFSVIATSLIKLRGYGLAAGNFSFMHYLELFTESPKARPAIANSFFLAFASATICVVLGTVIVVAIRKSKRSTGRLLEGMSIIPQMLPSIVLVIGLMLLWNRTYKFLPLYNTMGMLLLAYVVLFLPYTVQYVSSSFSQMSPSLNEAARVFGGKPFYIFRKITLPLLAPGITSAWMMTFIIAFRELLTASLLSPPNVLVISTFITREFEQGSVSVGMAMAVLCLILTIFSLTILNLLTKKAILKDE